MKDGKGYTPKERASQQEMILRALKSSIFPANRRSLSKDEFQILAESEQIIMMPITLMLSNMPCSENINRLVIEFMKLQEQAALPLGNDEKIPQFNPVGQSPASMTPQSVIQKSISKLRETKVTYHDHMQRYVSNDQVVKATGYHHTP